MPRAGAARGKRNQFAAYQSARTGRPKIRTAAPQGRARRTAVRMRQDQIRRRAGDGLRRPVMRMARAGGVVPANAIKRATAARGEPVRRRRQHAWAHDVGIAADGIRGEPAMATSFSVDNGRCQRGKRQQRQNGVTKHDLS
jgi:hypothetical protein